MHITAHNKKVFSSIVLALTVNLFLAGSALAVSNSINVTQEVLYEEADGNILPPETNPPVIVGDISRPIAEPIPELTEPIADKIPPPNVSDLIAEVLEDQVELSWKNPAEDDFAGVKIMRGDQFYPQDPFDGENILKGDYQEFTDKDVVQDRTYYYTLFTYDEHKNYSSGAIVSAKIYGPGEDPRDSEEDLFDKAVDEDRPWEDIMLEDFGLSLDDIIFTVNGVRVMPVDGRIDLYPEVPLNIAISYDKLPVVLKTIVFTLKSGSKSFSFISGFMLVSSSTLDSSFPSDRASLQRISNCF